MKQNDVCKIDSTVESTNILGRDVKKQRFEENKNFFWRNKKSFEETKKKQRT